MKTKIAITIGITSLTWTLMSAPPVVVVPVPPPPVPTVVVPVPAPPAVSVEIGVPDSYVWDGYEYVGVVGSAYFYLGPGDVWLPCNGPRIVRFHDWERGHADWRTHVIVNERFRHDAHGREMPSHDNHREHGH